MNCKCDPKKTVLVANHSLSNTDEETELGGWGRGWGGEGTSGGGAEQKRCEMRETYLPQEISDSLDFF